MSFMLQFPFQEAKKLTIKSEKHGEEGNKKCSPPSSVV
jgi:hypothetical protein